MKNRGADAIDAIGLGRPVFMRKAGDSAQFQNPLARAIARTPVLRPIHSAEIQQVEAELRF
jgi:hypothetical protein